MLPAILLVFVFLKKVKESADFGATTTKRVGLFLKILSLLLVSGALSLLASRIEFAPSSGYTSENLCLFSSLPFGLNILISVFIYAEALGFVLSLLAGVMNEPRNPTTALNMFKVWTGICLSILVIVLTLWGIYLIDFTPLWNFIAWTVRTLRLFTVVPILVIALLSILSFIKLISSLPALMIWLRQSGLSKGAKILKITITVTLLSGLIALAAWGGIYLLPLLKQAVLYLLNLLISAVYAVLFSDKLGLILVFIVMSVALGLLIWILAAVTRILLPYFPGFWRLPSVGIEEWRLQLEALEADRQAMLIRRTTASSLNLSDSAFLALLRRIEKHIKKEPALSAYWAKRNDLEVIDRQQRI